MQTLQPPVSEPTHKAAQAVLAYPAAVRPVDLAGLDDVGGEALALFCWSDVRPLKGVLGLVDWRLCGAVSRAIEAHLFAGALGDTLLLPLTERIGPARLFVLGIGPISAWDNEVLRGACRRACEVTRRAGVSAPTLGSPACLGDVQIEQAFVNEAAKVLGPQPEPLLVERL